MSFESALNPAIYIYVTSLFSDVYVMQLPVCIVSMCFLSVLGPDDVSYILMQSLLPSHHSKYILDWTPPALPPSAGAGARAGTGAWFCTDCSCDGVSDSVCLRFLCIVVVNSFVTGIATGIANGNAGTTGNACTTGNAVTNGVVSGATGCIFMLDISNKRWFKSLINSFFWIFGLEAMLRIVIMDFCSARTIFSSCFKSAIFLCVILFLFLCVILFLFLFTPSDISIHFAI